MGSGEDLLNTPITLNSSSSNKFGSFILHAAVDFKNFREDAVFTLSSESESKSKSARYRSFGLWPTGFNGICGKCDYSGDKGWQWIDNDDLRCYLCRELNNISGGGGGGGELSIDDDQQQQQHQHQQQQLVLKLGNLGFPSCYSFGKPPSKVMVVGSCDGLICLYDKQSNDVSFWNPATSQFRILPKSSSSSITTIDALAAGGGDGNVHRLLAFGFDDKTKDYKVVLLSVSNRRMLDFEIKDEPAAPLECVCGVQVYSSSTNSWKLLEAITSLPGSPFPYPPPDSSSELFYLNGCCFFMAKLLYSSSSSSSTSSEKKSIPPPKNGDRFMISLDLTKEIVTPIELPEDTHHQQLSSLFYLGKKIAFYFILRGFKRVDGVSCNLFKISVFNERSSSVGHKAWICFSNFKVKVGFPGERIILRGISNDAVFALLETEMPGGGGGGGEVGSKKQLKLYNIITAELKENFLSCDQVLSKAFPYEPTQVWIYEPSQVW